MGHSYGLLTSWDIPAWVIINFMGHSYGLLTGTFLRFINMGHPYGLLTAWGIPMDY